MAELRTEPPWMQSKSVPSEYEIVAEFPCVTWGWECDTYYWILRDASGKLVLGATNHGRFYICKNARKNLENEIKQLTEFVSITLAAMEFLEDD